ncbi:MAG: L,D-transpeptidase [Pseudolabrys sp.]|jgi:hypothetical protein
MYYLPGFFAALAFSAAALSFGAPARANILITIDKAKQQMTVRVDGDPRYIWPVSTGRAGYNTPNGNYRPTSMERQHYSRKYAWAPMPHSIFFTNEGHAIHGTYEEAGLGHARSHGCVRISRAHASILYRLVKAEGMKNTRVVLEGHIPGPGQMVAQNDGGDDISARRRTYDDGYNDAPPPRRVYRHYRRRYYRAPFPIPIPLPFGF